MEILSNNFRMPTNVRQLNQSNLISKPKALVNYNYSSLTFKSSKSQITKEVGESILKNLNLTPEAMKEIFSNPKKFKTLLDVVGGLILSAATAITGLIYMEDDNTEKFDDTFVKSNMNSENLENNIIKEEKVNSKTETEAESEEEVNIAPEAQAKTRKIRKAKEEDLEVGGIKKEKFKRAFHKHPRKEETQYSKYIENNFNDDIELWNANTRLFNQIAGENKDGAHIYEGVVYSNSELLKKVLPEIMDAKADRAKILEIVAKYSALEQTDLQANKDESKAEKAKQIENKPIIDNENVVNEKKSQFKVNISKPLVEVMNGKDKIMGAYKNIIEVSQTKEIAEERLNSVNELIYPWSNNDNKTLDYKLVMLALKSINQCYSDCLEELAHVYIEEFSKNTCAADDFYRKIASKAYLQDAVKTYDASIKKLGLSFTQYNELKKAGMKPENIKKIAQIMYNSPIELNDIKYDNGLLELKFPDEKPINNYFSTIKRVFELVHDEKITLEAKEKTEFSKSKIVDELIKDYRDNNNTTYPNLVKFLYGPKHIIYNEGDFNKNQFEDRFSQLVNILNDDKLFDPNLFGDHAKMRFLERFVIGKCDWKNIEENAYGPMRRFVDLLKNSLYQNTSIRRYVARYSPSGNPIVGAQIIVKDYNDKEITFTLNNAAKIHTIF